MLRRRREIFAKILNFTLFIIHPIEARHESDIAITHLPICVSYLCFLFVFPICVTYLAGTLIPYFSVTLEPCTAAGGEEKNG